MALLQQLELLLAQMLSPENEVRSPAEKQYEQIALDQKGTLLFQVYLNPSAKPEVRGMALVLLRRILSNEFEEFWQAVGTGQQAQFYEQLLKCTTEESDGSLRKKLGDVVAEIARNTINEDTGKQEWAGVLQYLAHCCRSEDASHRETGMLLIENVPNIFGSDQHHYMHDIKTMFQQSLLYAADSSVRTAAVRAYVAFVVDNEEDEQLVKSLSDLVPAVIKVCQHVLQTEDDDDVPLQCLSDLASSVPKTLTPHLNDIFTMCSTTVANTEKDDSYRHSSLEVMVALCESSPNVIRKRAAAFIPTLIQLCLQLMTELDDDISEWLEMDDADQETDEENATIGETSLDRVSCALGGKTVLQPTLQHVTGLLKSEDWKHRHAGIMALSTIGEGCKRQMEPHITQVITDFILPATDDPHPRVRYAGCNAVGQMCTDFAPTVQKKCHERIVPALLGRLIDLSTPRVAAHAGAAIVNFCEDCPKTIITVYLPQIMERMEHVLDLTYKQLVESRKKLVLEQVITSIASVADAAQDHFVQFYERLMPPLKFILQNSNVDELKMLRGKTIECVSLIGLAVGREVFAGDAKEIMQILLSAGANFDSEDPQVSYMISAWARICKILGPDFAPYLPQVMPAVIKAADFKPEVTMIEEEEVQEDNDEWNYISIGDQKSLGIRTAGLEDKVTACEMIVCYARELKEAFLEWVEPVMKLMLPMLKFLFHDGVRSAAAEAFPCLLACAKSQGAQVRRHMWSIILPAYKEAIDKETDLEVLCELLNGVGQCVEELGVEVVSPDDLAAIFGIIHEQMTKFEHRREERLKANKDEEMDEEELEQMNELVEIETMVIARISDCVHYSFQAFKDQLIPYFDKLVPQFSALLGERRPYQDRQWGLCMFDDLVEFGGEASIRYQPIFLEPMINGLADQYPEVRQAAAYGVGLMAMKGGAAYAPACTQALQPLAAMIARTDARATEEDTAATENAISAVSKILKYNASTIDVNAVIPTFISWLPVWEDTEEVPHVYDYFCDLIESNHPLVLGENNANLPRILEIILHAFSHGAFDEKTETTESVKARMANIAKMIRANDEVFQTVLRSLTLNSHQQEVLRGILDG